MLCCVTLTIKIFSIQIGYSTSWWNEFYRRFVVVVIFFVFSSVLPFSSHSSLIDISLEFLRWRHSSVNWISTKYKKKKAAAKQHQKFCVAISILLARELTVHGRRMNVSESEKNLKLNCWLRWTNPSGDVNYVSF